MRVKGNGCVGVAHVEEDDVFISEEIERRPEAEWKRRGYETLPELMGVGGVKRLTPFFYVLLDDHNGLDNGEKSDCAVCLLGQSGEIKDAGQSSQH